MPRKQTVTGLRRSVTRALNAWEMPMPHAGSWIQRLRKKRQISTAKMASLMGMNERNYRKLETKANMNLSTFYRFVTAIGLKITLKPLEDETASVSEIVEASEAPALPNPDESEDDEDEGEDEDEDEDEDDEDDEEDNEEEDDEDEDDEDEDEDDEDDEDDE